MRALRSGLASVLAGLMAAGPLALRARAEPVLQEVVSGEVSVSEVGPGVYDVDATNGSIGRYSSFDVAVDETVHVNIDADGGSHLARVTSADPTQVFGHLLSNGHVYLVNPAGVYFAPGSSFDGVGLHAVAGDIDESRFGPRFGLEGEDRYTSLEGVVENLGAINAEVVDLVGQYVRNAGIIDSGTGSGFFALVVGDDVTISRRMEDGQLGLSVTIEGLATEVVDRMGAVRQPGLVLDHSIDGRIDAGTGEVFGGARVGATLGAGDLVGVAIQYVGRRDGGGEVVPDTLTAGRVTLASDGFFLEQPAEGDPTIAGAADLEVAGGIDADTVRLCAGTPCYDADGEVALAETASTAEPRAEVRFGPDALIAEGAAVTLIQDADLTVDEGVAAVLGGRDLDLRLQVSDDLDVGADLDAHALDLHAGADGSGDLRVGGVELAAGDISLRAGDGDASAEVGAAVSISPDATLAGAGGAGSPDSLSLSQDADLAVTADLATRLSNAGWDLAVESGGDLSVEAGLQAASLDLHAGAERDGELRVGTEDAAVTLAADRQSLRAGRDDGLGSSRVTLVGDARFVSTDGSAAPQSFALVQEAGITGVDGQLPTADSFTPAGMTPEDALAGGIDLALRSHAGGVSLDADALAALSSLLARADLGAEIDGVAGIRALDDVELGATLEARALRIESDFGTSRFAGDVRATEGDAELVGPVEFSGDGDQAVVADAGRVLLRSSFPVTAGSDTPDPVRKSGGGDLRLSAGAPDDPEARPIELGVDVTVVGGNLAIESAFSAAGDLRVSASAEGEGGALQLATPGTFDGHFIEELSDDTGALRARDQTVSAESLLVASGTELVKTSGGALLLEGTGEATIDGTVRVENSLGTTDADGAPVASALEISGGTVQIGTGAPAELSADAVALRGSTVEVGDVAVAAPQSLLVEQEAALTAASLPDPTSGAFDSGVPETYTVRSTGGAIAVDGALAARLNGLDTDLTLDAAHDLAVHADLDSRELTLRAGSSPPAEESPNLVVGAEGAPVTLRADAQTLHAQGTGAIDLSNATLLDTAGGRAPLALTLRTDAAFDSADDVPERTALGDIPDGERMSYTLQSDTGEVSVDAALAGRLAGPFDLSLLAASDVRIDSTLNALTYSLRAGAGGDDAAAVRIGEGAQLLGLGGGAPEAFALEQHGSIDDDDIPTAEVFGGSVAGMAYALRSHGGAVEVATRAKIAGTDLTLGGSDGVSVVLETDEALELRSLAVEHIGAGGAAALGQSLVATAGDIAIATDLELIPQDVELLAETGDVALAGDVSSRDGGAVLLSAPAGDVTVAGALRAGGAAGPGSVAIDAVNVTVADVSTAGDAVDPEMPEPAGAIDLNASGSLRIDGDLDATSESGDGDVVLAAGDRIAIGPGGGQILVSGRDVTFGAAVDRAPEEGDPVLHSLAVDASGGALFVGDVAIDSLRVSAAGDLELQGDVATRRVDGGVGPGGPILLGGAIDLAAGTDGTGALILSGDDARLGADRVSLAGETLDLGTARLVGLEGGAPDATFLRQAPSIIDAGALLAHLGESPGAELAGLTVGLHSDAGAVLIDPVQASALSDTRLVLGGVDGALVDDGGEPLPGVVVLDSLDVESLDLDSSAEVRGDLTVRAPSLVVGNRPVGLAAEGDLTVLGDLTLLAQGVFDGAQSQTVTATGALTAPRLSSRLGAQPTALTLRAGDGLDLVGSLEGGRLVSVDAEGRLLFIEDDVALAGDLLASGDIELGGAVTLNGVSDQRLVSTGGVVRAEVDLVKDAAGVLRPGDASLELGGAGFDVRGDVTAADDLTLVGTRTLRLDDGEDTRRLEATGGTLTLVGGTDAAGANAGVALELHGGAGIEVQGDATVVAREVTVESAVRGSGALRIDVTAAGDAGRIELQDDVAIDSSGALELRSAAIAGIQLSGAGRLEAGSILLNPGARAPAPRATIVRDGDLVIAATGGGFEMGSGEKLTVLGTLDISAAERALVADLTATEIAVSAPRIELVSRAPGVVELPDGSTAADTGTDLVANRILFWTRPTGTGALVTPTGTEVSDTLASDDLLRRTLGPGGRTLGTGDLRSLLDDGVLDGVGLGATLFEAGRQLAVQTDVQQPLARVVLAGLNQVAVSARPLWAEELVAHLETASMRGQPLARRADDDPRLQTEAVREAVRLYTSLLAPTALVDEETGARIVRSHRDRIRAAFARALEGFTRERPGEPLTGRSFASYVELEPDHSEALFYLGTLGDLVREARRAGIADYEIDLFKRLLVRDLAPEGLTVEQLAEAVPD